MGLTATTVAYIFGNTEWEWRWRQWRVEDRSSRHRLTATFADVSFAMLSAPATATATPTDCASDVELTSPCAGQAILHAVYTSLMSAVQLTSTAALRVCAVGHFSWCFASRRSTVSRVPAGMRSR